MFTTAVERGLLRPSLPKKRILLEAPDDEQVEKRYKGTSCFACGRKGHKKTEWSFLEQENPDVNIENNPWTESTNGKAWALKDKKVLQGKITLSGDYFNYVMNKK